MGVLRDRMAADLKTAGYSPRTAKIYLLYARNYAAFHMRSPAEMGADEIRRFMLYLIDECGNSRETLRQVRGALLFLYRVTFQRPVDVAHLAPPRRQKPLPVVLGGAGGHRAVGGRREPEVPCGPLEHVRRRPADFGGVPAAAGSDRCRAWPDPYRPAARVASIATPCSRGGCWTSCATTGATRGPRAAGSLKARRARATSVPRPSVTPSARPWWLLEFASL